MGQSSISQIDANNQNYGQYARTTNNSNQMEEQIKKAFKQASSNGRLTKEKFNEALGIFESLQLQRIKDTPLAERLFFLFTKDDEQYITEKEYLDGIKSLYENKDRRILYSFKILDKAGKNNINIQEFFEFVKESWLCAFRLLGEKVCSGPNQYQLTQSKINNWAQGQLNQIYSAVLEIFSKFAGQNQFMDISTFQMWVKSNQLGFVRAEIGGDFIQVPLHLYRLEEK